MLLLLLPPLPRLLYRRRLRRLKDGDCIGLPLQPWNNAMRTTTTTMGWSMPVPKATTTPGMSQRVVMLLQQQQQQQPYRMTTPQCDRSFQTVRGMMIVREQQRFCYNDDDDNNHNETKTGLHRTPPHCWPTNCWDRPLMKWLVSWSNIMYNCFVLLFTNGGIQDATTVPCTIVWPCELWQSLQRVFDCFDSFVLTTCASVDSSRVPLLICS
jgi:hypothetical protein